MDMMLDRLRWGCFRHTRRGVTCPCPRGCQCHTHPGAKCDSAVAHPMGEWGPVGTLPGLPSLGHTTCIRRGGEDAGGNGRSQGTEAEPGTPHRLSATSPAAPPVGPCSKADGDPWAWCVCGEGAKGPFQTRPAGFWQGLPSRRAWISPPRAAMRQAHRLSNLQGLLLEAELTSFSGLPLGLELLILSLLLPGWESGTGWGLRPWLAQPRWARAEVGGTGLEEGAQGWNRAEPLLRGVRGSSCLASPRPP